jgi:hypothetical protein
MAAIILSSRSSHENYSAGWCRTRNLSQHGCRGEAHRPTFQTGGHECLMVKQKTGRELHHERWGRVRPAPQAAECCPALQDFGLSCHSLALCGGLYLVYGERVCDATGAFINGLRNRCDWSPGLLDLAETGASVLVPRRAVEWTVLRATPRSVSPRTIPGPEGVETARADGAYRRNRSLVERR